MNTNKSDVSEAAKMLGLYKAEWLNGKLFELFNEPQYFGELKTKRPCVLIGGRGTGKTTVLKGLSYKGQFALGKGGASSIVDADFYGVYYRINTNRVTAFKGPELTEAKWTKYFAHYINLILCFHVLEFIDWYTVQVGEVIQLGEKIEGKIATSLCIGDEKNGLKLIERIENALVQFESAINSLSDNADQRLSLQGAPIDQLTEALVNTSTFKGKQFFFLIDEFENLEDYQQRVLNTLIKHATSAYTFKVGVRELGWRERATLNANEQLTSPADYAHVNIGDVMEGKKFAAFAAAVVGSRIFPDMPAGEVKEALKKFLPKLTEMEEAEELLDEAQIENVRKEAEKVLSEKSFVAINELPPARLCFAKFWNESRREESVAQTFESLISDPKLWAERVNNYFYSYLFTIRKGKSGIRKYYAGWDVFILLANGNIRYLLELIHAAVIIHLENEADRSAPISPATQTTAAQYVGKKNLDELQGLSVDGGHLTKLLLSLGRIFQLFADNPVGHTPEANQFNMKSSEDDDVNKATVRLINSAVMHLALIRSTGNKLADQRDTKEYDYMIHPVFAPFFVFSHRKKRKISLDASVIQRLVSQPRSAISEVMRINNRKVEDVLPDQLQLFGAFYE
jgi:hypothetical protein